MMYTADDDRLLEPEGEAYPMSELSDHEQVKSSRTHRDLEASHLEMIALGGTIGTGLFLGSGHVLKTAGPGGALAAFSLVGAFVYCVVTSLGEMAALIPVSGSFNEYATRFIDPALGFTMGWNYWFAWTMTLPIEMAAVSIAMQYWSNAPGWIWSALTLAICTLVNLFGVRSFGNVEYGFSLVKVLAIILFMIIGLIAIVINGTWFKNWYEPGAPFVGGLGGLFQVFLTAFFSYGGTELVGITAGEAKNPKETIPRAIKGTFWRILIFYTGALLVMGMMIPYNIPSLGNEGVSASPFTLALSQAHVPLADHALNLVVIVAVLSAGNSAMYASSRTLMALAKQGQAPHLFGETKNGVPIYAMSVSFGFAFIYLCLSSLGAEKLFKWMVLLSGFSTLISWATICVIHLRFRKAFLYQGHSLDELPYKSPFFPFAPLIAIGGCLIVLFGSGIDLLVRNEPFIEFIKLYLGVPLFPILYYGYKYQKGTSLVPLGQCDFSV